MESIRLWADEVVSLKFELDVLRVGYSASPLSHKHAY